MVVAWYMVPVITTVRGTEDIIIRDLLRMVLVFITIHIPVGDFLPDLVTDGSQCRSIHTQCIGGHVDIATDIVTDTAMVITEVTTMVTEQVMLADVTIRETYTDNVLQVFVQHVHQQETAQLRAQEIKMHAHRNAQIMYLPIETVIYTVEIGMETGSRKIKDLQHVQVRAQQHQVPVHRRAQRIRVQGQARAQQHLVHALVLSRQHVRVHVLQHQVISFSAIIRIETEERRIITITKETGLHHQI